MYFHFKVQISCILVHSQIQVAPNPNLNPHGKGVRLAPGGALESQWCTRRHERALCHPSQYTEPSVHVAIMKVVVSIALRMTIWSTMKGKLRTTMFCFPLLNTLKPMVIFSNTIHHLIKMVGGKCGSTFASRCSFAKLQ